MTKPAIHYLKDYQPSNFLIDTVFLHFDLHEENTIVKTILKIRRNPLAKFADAPLILNGRELKLISVLLNGKKLSAQDYQVDAETLTIKNVPDQFDLETVVEIKPQENKHLSGLYKSRNNFCTQCEAEGFRYITYYLDRPDVMSRFTTTISADKKLYPHLLSNGNLIESRMLEDGRHWVHWQDPSLKPCYLFALVAGDFDLLQDQFTTQSDRVIDLRLYVEKGFGDQGEYALQALKRAMRWDEERFGREYDLDIYMVVAVSDFNMGAMENKGLNIFNTKYILAKSDTATDADYRGIESVLGHEYFHNWSGNRVTCRDWFQITLKEGLTVFREQLFEEDMTSKAVARLDTANGIRTRQFLEDAGPLSHPIRPDSYMEINNFYTATVYQKGSEVIRMIQTLLTPEIFHKGMNLYFHRHDGQAVTTEQFVKAMEDASGKDLTQFRRWYSQAGTPTLDVSGQYNEAAKTYQLTVKQSCSATPGQSHKEPLHIPLAIGLYGENGQELKIKLAGEEVANSDTKVLEIRQSTQQFLFEDVAVKPVPSLLRDFSAPVQLNYDYSEKDLTLLLQYDSNSFSRWNANQQLVTRAIYQLMDNYANGGKLVVNNSLIEAFKAVLDSNPKDLNFLSRLLILPTENYLLSTRLKSDIGIITLCRKAVKQQLAEKLEHLFLSYYEKNALSGPYQYNSEHMGHRNIRSVCLSYLMDTGKKQYQQLAYEQFKNANNMTDRISALSALNQHDCDERKKALHQLYETWSQEPLVVNKWLLLEATARVPNTTERVEELLTHPSFNLQNPNNVYALLGGYGENVVSFHSGSDKGYRLLANQVLAIDAFNPQVASRMIKPLTQWRMYDVLRADLMKQELQRIAKQSHLSKDLREITTKSIE